MPSSKNETATATYVYGIVPARAKLKVEANGVGDPPSVIEVIEEGEIAALISEVPRDRALGSPEDLRAHAQVLDEIAAHSPVLPLRFGAVLANADAVAEELLEAHQDEFRDALNELEGRAQYLAKGRYVEKAIIKEILDEVPKAAQLREKLRGQPEDAGREDRIALGELINNEISRRRDRETKRVAETLQSLDAQVNVRPPTHELDAFQVSCLAEVARQGDLEDALGKLADEWRGYVQVQLLGPLAPYDFVTTNKAKT